MQLHAVTTDPTHLKADLLIVPVFENEFAKPPASLITRRLGPTAAAQAKVEGFTGKHGQTLHHFAGSRLSAPRVLFLGLGKREKLSAKQLRKALESALKEARRLKISNIAVADVPSPEGKSDPAVAGRILGETAGTVDYVMNHRKTEKGGHKKETRFAAITAVAKNSDRAALDRGMHEGLTIATAVNRARDLVTQPAGELTPNELAKTATQVARNSKGRIKIKLYRGAELKRLRADAFLAVARGSDELPVLIEMSYEPRGADRKKLLALVGKSVTFDSGGYDLKPAASMRNMKCDMSGGAATLAAISAIAALNLPARVKVIMAATENMVSGRAYKPGDVLNTMAGLTVEVDNTDAEGRLTLADAIEFARRKGATHIVDVATLTGAIRIVLGTAGAGVFGNTREFTQAVVDAAESAGERVWELPMWEELARNNDSKIADIKNSGGDVGAGSINAAHFLARFADKTPWVHMDIASVAFEHEQGTGWGVRTLVELAKRFGK
jgi:leucyl aminopeptidase